ncbi:MAG: Stp1/IreP family PP2C-type Ser/Thr phosphatase [Subdoligranulum sp.]|nr:Stp1/IreP family PP2C-type Ser/Thr phosphatase [Subdoligranulum sp.]
MKLVGATDIGLQRNENQDSYRAGHRSDGTAWGVVCDGMGGAKGGRMASSLACAVMERVVEAGLERQSGAPQPPALLSGALEQANRVVYEKACETPDLEGMGTTAVCVLVCGGMAYYAHVGDSRLYLCRNGRLHQLTKDHSMVQELVEQGRLTEEEAENHPRKNLITRAIGVGEELQPDFGAKEVSPRDILLLCSDGLSNCVQVGEIEHILAHISFFDTAQALVMQALRGGGHDNITVLLIQIEGAEESNG